MCLSPWFRSASDDQNLIQHIPRPVSESVWIGEAQAVEERLRSGAVTVRAFLRERYGVRAGKSERGDSSDLKQFQMWLADALVIIINFTLTTARRAFPTTAASMTFRVFSRNVIQNRVQGA